MIDNNWKHKEIWNRRGTGYCVEVSHHREPPFLYAEGIHRWCVYVYIYPEHPHFSKFNGNDMWQEAAIVLPLHCGPSYLRWHRDDNGNPTSIQVGADYHHDGDNAYTHYETADDAMSVFYDANKLMDWLEKHNLNSLEKEND